MMGFLLLATAVYFVQPLFGKILSDDIFWWTMFTVIAGGGVFLIVRGLQLAKTSLGRAISITIALMMIVPSFFTARLLTAKPYDWIPYSEQALAAANASGRPVLIDFTATWCGNCHYLEAFVINRSAVVKAVHSHDVLMLKGDVTNDNAPARPLLAKLTDVGTIPLTAVYFPHQNQPKLLDGIYSVDDLVRVLNSGG
jgi:thiol:disulfide interchange protein DsbD